MKESWIKEMLIVGWKRKVKVVSCVEVLCFFDPSMHPEI